MSEEKLQVHRERYLGLPVGDDGLNDEDYGSGLVRQVCQLNMNMHSEIEQKLSPQLYRLEFVSGRTHDLPAGERRGGDAFPDGQRP